LQADFEPIFRNAHALTIAANFWPREIDQRRFPATRKQYQIDHDTTVVGYEHQPEMPARGQIMLLHGLEGSADAGYIRSFAQEALMRGFVVHRLNFRTCGGTEKLCRTTYHSGLTSDTLKILEQLQEGGGPMFVVGFSLGGNVVLKLAGELGETKLVAGVCAISAPIDLAVCVRRTAKRVNYFYARRFLKRLKKRIEMKSELAPEIYNRSGLHGIKSIWEFDDRFTAQLFGFGSAANYYQTQSAARYLDAIRVPTLVICAKDDPLVPFEIYNHPAFQSNPNLTLLAVEHGGHLGFLSRRGRRFWVDGVALDWMESLPDTFPGPGTTAAHFTSV
jgi:predicted alpha/beta-fold hydrolase